MIGLTRDIDLADDLAQETYLHARRGFAGYRGGEACAWFAAIARQVFFHYLRRRRAHRELPIEEATDATATFPADHAILLDLRQAIAALPATLREALLLKHYGGFSYQEIAQRQHSPEGTAKWRVSAAITRLKAALRTTEEQTMACRTLRGIRLVDYLSGVLPEKDARRIRAHLERCAACKRDAETLRRLVATLDAVEGDFCATQIIELDTRGVPTKYCWSSTANVFPFPMPTEWWMLEKEFVADYAMVEGHEVVLEQLPGNPRQYQYEAVRPTVAPPGGRMNALFVFHPIGRDGCAEQLDEGRWRFTVETSPNTGQDWVFTHAIRLPPGARLSHASPQPTDVHEGCGVTVIWRTLLRRITTAPPPGQSPIQFRCTIAYAQTITAAPAEPVPHPTGMVIRAPDIVFTILEDPRTATTEEALARYRAALAAAMVTPKAWLVLGIELYRHRRWSEALDAVARAAAHPERVFPPYHLCALTWQGQLLDLLNRRDEAVTCYRQALARYPHDSEYAFRQRQYGIDMNRRVIEHRLHRPFSGEEL